MDPRIQLIEQTLRQRPAQQIARDGVLREAAVALLLRPREQLELLLIKRATHERDPWSGHMALPGGRRSPADRDLIETAFRETEEEVGIRLHRPDCFLGALDEVAPATPRLPPIVIAPFVAVVPESTTTQPDPREVEFTVWVPVASLREPGAAGEILIHFEGGSRPFPSLTYGEHVIWGLTLRILTQFLSLLQGNE